jgi:hypothetical protein
MRWIIGKGMKRVTRVMRWIIGKGVSEESEESDEMDHWKGSVRRE